MFRWLVIFICLSVGLIFPMTAMADNHEGEETKTEVDVSTATFDVTEGFEQVVNLETLTTLQWTFVKAEATATYSITVPGKQLPATGWKEFYDGLGWDTAQTNVTEITFSDGTKTNLYSQVIGNSGEVRFWMDSVSAIDTQTVDIETKEIEKGLYLKFTATRYYIIWVNGQEFARIHDNQVVIDQLLVKGSNRITIEQTDEQFASLETRDIYRLSIEWNKDTITDVAKKDLIQIIVASQNGKIDGPDVELAFQWTSEEPLPESVWYIYLNGGTEAIQTQDLSYKLTNLSPGTYQVKVELRTINGEVIGETETTFTVSTQNGGILPDTGTPWPNGMALGVALMIAGAIVWFRWGRDVA